ncbi:MAG: SDR family NAD(P)-dependent oxidoreductase [Pirellulaceae bacterium]|nr:SDR family NAD(P)-dependent oxidoreductase [Pirellulaceae bacterium]
MLSIDLRDKVCLVTGGNRGIGLQIGRTLAQAGATVVLTARTTDGLNQIADAAQAVTAPGSITGLPCDVTDAASVKSLFQSLHQTYGRLDAMVANAGILQDALVGMATEEQISQTLAVNTAGVLRCCQYASRLMARHKSGSIVLMSSVVGRTGNAGQSVYAGSKAAVIGIGKSLAQELGPQGIRVNVIAPGLIDTDMTRNLPPDKRQAFLDHVALGRSGTTQEVANLAVFLVSDLAGYVTGQVIGVDGGK